jgi:hypothetical protein
MQSPRARSPPVTPDHVECCSSCLTRSPGVPLARAPPDALWWTSADIVSGRAERILQQAAPWSVPARSPAITSLSGDDACGSLSHIGRISRGQNKTRFHEHREGLQRPRRRQSWAVGNPQGMFAARKLPDLGASVALQLLCSCSCGNHARNKQARPRGSAPAPRAGSRQACWSGSNPHTPRDTRRSVRSRGAQSTHVNFPQPTLQLPIRTCSCATQITSANAAAVSQTSSWTSRSGALSMAMVQGDLYGGAVARDGGWTSHGTRARPPARAAAALAHACTAFCGRQKL